MARASITQSDFRDPPRKQVLLLSCMDLRLCDDVVHYMNEFNLENRYDHVIFAGAAMGVRRLPHPSRKGAGNWRTVFFDHLTAAIDVLHRDIKDIFILEHADCGAYKHLHPEKKIKRKYEACDSLKKWAPFHKFEAEALAKEIRVFCKKQQKPAWKKIKVRCLIMDLRGVVSKL